VTDDLPADGDASYSLLMFRSDTWCRRERRALVRFLEAALPDVVDGRRLDLVSADTKLLPEE
jgi:hypothetical protein